MVILCRKYHPHDPWSFKINFQTKIFIKLLLDLFIRNSLAPEKVSAKINGKQLSTQTFNDLADDNEFETSSETDSVIPDEDD
jgi:hypothetical protein